MTGCLRVGYHAPPPGSRTGIADYAETLRKSLAQRASVEDGAESADIHLYQLGNNRLHEEIYARALAVPGVIVLHDAVLHHFFLGTLPHDAYIAEWVYNYGEWRRDLGEELWLGRAKSSVDPRYFQFPMLRRVLERSRAAIVHNPGAAAILRAANPALPIEIIPHLCEVTDPPDAFEIMRFRERLGVAASTRLFGMFGYLREPKRVMPCIRAFQRLHAVNPDTALLLAGEVVSGDLARLLTSEVKEIPAIRRLGHLSERDFRIAGAAVDCCLNLRYPAAGESSGIAVRLMSLGKPVIVTDNAENADFPLAAVLRNSAGVAEAEELFDHMLLVTQFPTIAREIGIEARRHIREQHSLDSVTRNYWEVLCAAASSSR
ncbi:MAG: hypothetical protein M3N93_10150 [Acidobacteriota bacterium]|nr:hypothetical protein [Acidobacteriota bacterium]